MRVFMMCFHDVPDELGGPEEATRVPSSFLPSGRMYLAHPYELNGHKCELKLLVYKHLMRPRPQPLIYNVCVLC
jgi:hypothetical protein